MIIKNVMVRDIVPGCLVIDKMGPHFDGSLDVFIKIAISVHPKRSLTEITWLNICVGNFDDILLKFGKISSVGRHLPIECTDVPN